MRVLVVYIFFVIVGQALAVGVGLLLDPYSISLALAVFIPLYYAMYWFAWRLALYLVDRSPDAKPAATGDRGGPGAAVASWLLVPAVLAVELCD